MKDGMSKYSLGDIEESGFEEAVPTVDGLVQRPAHDTCSTQDHDEGDDWGIRYSA